VIACAAQDACIYTLPVKERSRQLCAQIARECTANSLRRASREVSAAFDKALEGSGLRGTQFTLLTALTLGAELPVTRLAEVLSLDRTTLTRNLAPLERDGLIESRATPDGRVRKLALTRRGEEALERALPKWEAAQKRLKNALGERKWKELMSTLQSL
jgi:DNA-binding MarR family transcriptional regulator